MELKFSNFPLQPKQTSASKNTSQSTQDESNSSTDSSEETEMILLYKARIDHHYNLRLLNKALDVNSQKKKIIWKKSHACTVVLASDGYPLKYKKNIVINDTGTDNNNTKIFHSGTVFDGTNTVTNGGRVLSITALGNDLEESVRNAYARVGEINWDGMVYRKDIAKKEIEKKFIFS